MSEDAFIKFILVCTIISMVLNIGSIIINRRISKRQAEMRKRLENMNSMVDKHLL